MRHPSTCLMLVLLYTLFSLCYGTASYSPGLYWTDGSSIHYADSNGQNKTSVATGLTQVSDLFVDLDNQCIYFIQQSTASSARRLYRLNHSRELKTVNTLQPIYSYTIDPTFNDIYYERVVNHTTREFHRQNLDTDQSTLITTHFSFELMPLSDMYFDVKTQEIVTLGFAVTAGNTPGTVVRMQRITLQGATNTFFSQSIIANNKPDNFDYDPNSGTYYLADRLGKPVRSNHPDFTGIWRLDNAGLSPVGLKGTQINDIKFTRGIIYYSTKEGIGFINLSNPQHNLTPDKFISEPAFDMVVNIPKKL